MPFSFLMHHHQKMNKAEDGKEQFFKPKVDLKIDNFMEGMGKNHKIGIVKKKTTANNLSSNI